MNDKFYKARENHTWNGRPEKWSTTSIGEKGHPRNGVKTRDNGNSAMKRNRS
jgi:hypothetical protein